MSMDLTQITGYETIGVDPSTASAGGRGVAAHASAHTKGAWVELAAATAADACWVDAFIGFTNANTSRYLVDIALGAAGSEQVLLPDLYFETTILNTVYVAYRFPVAIPAGSRVAARCQSSVGGAVPRVAAILAHGPIAGMGGVGGVRAFGVDAADTTAADANPSATTGGKGAWVEFSAATPDRLRWLVAAFGHEGGGVSAFVRWVADVGIGVAGSEAVLIGDVPLAMNPTGDAIGPPVLGFPVDIPAGTRLVGRVGSMTTSTNNQMEMALYGVDAPAPAGTGGGGQHAHASWSF